MGTAYWFGYLSQCSMQNALPQKHSIWYESCFKKYLIAKCSSNWWARIHHCVPGSFILVRVTGQLIVHLKLFSNGTVH